MTDPELLQHCRTLCGGRWTTLARVLAVTPGAIDHWRRGRYAMPGPARQLCRVLVAAPTTTLYHALVNRVD